MPYPFLADAVIIIHLLFILFVIAGGGLVLWRRIWAWLHVPAVLWGALVELNGWICPLTPLENRLRRCGGHPVYDSDFVERYIVGLIYPTHITRREQIMLGLAVLLINGGVYGWLIIRGRRPGKKPAG